MNQGPDAYRANVAMAAPSRVSLSLDPGYTNAGFGNAGDGQSTRRYSPSNGELRAERARP